MYNTFVGVPSILIILLVGYNFRQVFTDQNATEREREENKVIFDIKNNFQFMFVFAIRNALVVTNFVAAYVHT